MKPFHLLVSLLISCSFLTCGDDKSDPEGAGVDTVETADTENPNEDNTDIYDVDPDDPYLVSNGIFLGLKPGEPLGPYEDGLRKGRIKTGDGDYDVYFIDGAEGDELGFVMPDQENKKMIESIFITSRSVVTEKGVRIGISYEDLVERIGKITFHGSEIEARVYGSKHGLYYRLDMNYPYHDLDNSTIEPDTKVTQIVIDRRPTM